MTLYFVSSFIPCPIASLSRSSLYIFTKNLPSNLGEFSGYEWVFEAQEPMPMYEVLPFTAVAFDQGAFTYAGKVTS